MSTTTMGAGWTCQCGWCWFVPYGMTHTCGFTVPPTYMPPNHLQAENDRLDAALHKDREP